VVVGYTPPCRKERDKGRATASSFIAELVPGLDLVPTWTLAVLFVTRDFQQVNVPVTEPPTIEGKL
jgi:hypothetical protein